MDLADECRRRALILMEISTEIPDFEAQLLFVAEQWLTVAAIEEMLQGRVANRPMSQAEAEQRRAKEERRRRGLAARIKQIKDRRRN
jgi:hypothetical protein